MIQIILIAGYEMIQKQERHICIIVMATTAHACQII